MTIKSAGIIEQVEIHWPTLHPDKPGQYKDGPHKWGVQFRVYDRDKKNQLKRDFKFDFTEVDDDPNNIYWRASVSKYAYRRNKETNKEDFSLKNKPVSVIKGNGEVIDDVETIGNGSIANLSITARENEYGTVSKTLLGVQVTRHIIYTPADKGVEFTLTDDYEAIENVTDGEVEDSEDMDY